jgi:hypothetical protein
VNRSAISSLLVLVAVTGVGTAKGAPEGPSVDVVVRDVPPPHRAVVVEWNPLALVAIGKLSLDVIITPADHHGLVLSPFYASATTRPITVFDDAGTPTQLPQQSFTGFGGELGYRYYVDKGGPRGFFLGPSLLLGSFRATAHDGATTSYMEYGLAADAGYQMLIANRASLSLGGGIQWVTATKAIPDQQFPAWIYANSRLSPRVLFSFGWAL